MKTPRSVAIIGGGPAGSSLATHLVRAGIRVALFRAPKRPELLIGESLIPEVITHLRELGVEQEIASFSTYKPGATFYLSKTDKVQFDFSFGAGEAPGYAYNTPRDQFDQAILCNAEKCGATVFPFNAEVEFEPSTRVAGLSDKTMAEAGGWFESQPDFIIDATGRTRMFSRMLNIPYREGKRKDAALFAHLKDVDVPYAGHIHVNRLQRGWSWRIPLPGRTSVGIVAPHEWVDSFGESTTEQYDSILQNEPAVQPFIHGPRVTRVMKYSNYQLISDEMFGPNWALVGDAAGFIDPVFSSGLLLSFSGAKLLAKTLVEGSELGAYERFYRRHLRGWQRVVDLFYDGRFFGLVRVGRAEKDSLVHGAAIQNLTLHLTRILTGVAPSHPETQRILHTTVRRYFRGENEYRLRIL